MTSPHVLKTAVTRSILFLLRSRGGRWGQFFEGGFFFKVGFWHFSKKGFFARWVFGIFLKKVFCKVFFFKKLNDVLKGGGFFFHGGGVPDLVVNFIHFFYPSLRLTRNPYVGQIHMSPQ